MEILELIIWIFGVVFLSVAVEIATSGDPLNLRDRFGRGRNK